MKYVIYFVWFYINKKGTTFFNSKAKSTHINHNHKQLMELDQK